MSRHPKILLLGDYSNCHRVLADGLRELGCDVTVASNGTWWMNTERDVDISRRPGKIGGLLHYLKMHRLLRGQLSGFDIVALNDPNFSLVKPSRLRKLFDIVKKNNKSVFLTAMSTDIAYLTMLTAADSPLKYSEWTSKEDFSRLYEASPEEFKAWFNPELTTYQNYVFDNLDGAVSVLYEYHLGMVRRLGEEKSAYGGIPIPVADYQQVTLPENPDLVKFFLGRDKTRKLQKGSDLLEEAAKIVIQRHPGKATLQIVENVPFGEFKELLRSSHVVLDQIYSYTPATTALMAMAYGLNTVSGGEPDFYHFIHEDENQPIINAPTELEDLVKVLEDVVLHPEKIAERGRKSREFVLKHNDSKVVARRFLDFWMRRLHEKGVEI